jgi:hypothetical protein
MATTYDKIATTTLGGAAANIDFTSIGSGYTDLKIILSGTNVSGNQDIIYQFNNDTSTNYSWTYLQGTGSAAGSGQATSIANIQLNAGAGISATIPYFAEIDIFSYAGGTFKTTLHSLSNDQNGSGAVQRFVGLWRSTSAITSVKISGSGSNLNTGTTATLYGILKA